MRSKACATVHAHIIPPPSSPPPPCAEIWDALKGVCDVEDMETVKLIIEASGIIVAAADMTLCYDERGRKEGGGEGGGVQGGGGMPTPPMQLSYDVRGGKGGERGGRLI